MKTLTGDRYIAIFLLKCYALGIIIFPLYYLFAITENFVFPILVFLCLALMLVNFMRFNSKYLISKLDRKELEKGK